MWVHLICVCGETWIGQTWHTFIKSLYQIAWKSIQWKPHWHMPTYKWRDMMKPKGTFYEYVNVPKKVYKTEHNTVIQNKKFKCYMYVSRKVWRSNHIQSRPNTKPKCLQMSTVWHACTRSTVSSWNTESGHLYTTATNAKDVWLEIHGVAIK
jgi:hypothetical protein